jgi:starch phosphorylase
MLTHALGVGSNADVPDFTYYQAAVLVVKKIEFEMRKKFWANSLSSGKKQVYYLSMEFLLGRSLKNCLYNLGIIDQMKEALATFDVTPEQLYEHEPDAGLGNGGLGRLAACYLDALANEGYLATGYCLRYEYGMFRQKIIDGWQHEETDVWLPGGEVWLSHKPGYEVEVRFGGEIEESWENSYHLIHHTNYDRVMAVPYDYNLPGYHSGGLSLLRLWRAKSSGGALDPTQDIAAQLVQNGLYESISKVLYPNDNHESGKKLRLWQQYFLCSASIADICRRHMSVYGDLSNFHEKNAIHINDTHPTLAIPELMRFLLDDCGYGWDPAWHIVTNTFGYTNHTVMKEAMESWNVALFKRELPRIFQIICEINRRFCEDLYLNRLVNQGSINRMSIVFDDQIRMANLAIVGSRCVNGVSQIHSEIIKEDVFRDFFAVFPEKFTNVTNGIASRRWLIQSNPSLTVHIGTTIGKDFDKDMANLAKLMKYTEDHAFLDTLAQSKFMNKGRFCKYIMHKTGVQLDPSSIFDTQVKRLHEYKRQHMNLLEIIATYLRLKESPNADYVPRTFIFGAKAAPGYYLAKQIIHLICKLSKLIEEDPVMREKMRVVFLEEYNVTLSELLMPASEISQQISLAGTEASGTGNMKLMLNGAITIGTLDGATVEILNEVGPGNILIFGMDAEEAKALKAGGYHPRAWYEGNDELRQAVDFLKTGLAGESGSSLHDILLTADEYMALADFASYRRARQRSEELYKDKYRWQKMSLINIAKSGYFCADRAVSEYARRIWMLDK